MPSPFFEDCPAVSALSVGTTESVVVDEVDSPEQFIWYRLEAEAGPYSVETTGRVVDESIVAYSVYLYDQFGQVDRSESIIFNSSTEDVASESANIEIDGPVYLAIEGQSSSTGVEFTVQAQWSGFARLACRFERRRFAFAIHKRGRCSSDGLFRLTIPGWRSRG